MEGKSLDHILEKLPERLREPLTVARQAYEDKVSEIVLRTDRPLCLYEGERVYGITRQGYLTDAIRSDSVLTVNAKEMEQIVLRLCDFSLYAFQNEVNSGYITIGGGVRVGLCGRAVITDGSVTNVRDIGTLNFRVARELPGCADGLLRQINPLNGVLICGAPGSGKTTLVRDMARQLSHRCRVSVLDERGELSAFSHGRCAFDLGLCDIYNGYPKGYAASCAIRSMAPRLIVCDEMGDRSDVELLLYSIRCGAAFIATVHADSMDDLRRREATAGMIATGAFRYVVFLRADAGLDRIGTIYEMRDAHG